MKDYIKIDENGYAVFKNIDLPLNQRGLDIITLKDEENIPDGYILAYEGGGFYHPKWTGEQWIEGLTQEEIDELNKQPTKELTEIEKLKISQAEQFETILELLGGM